MKRVVTAILGGGQGTRLAPLTKYRAKPAVPVGGKFRLIDIPISNSLHAGIDRIYVLTQFNSESLHRHIAQTYRFDAFRGGFVDILAAEQSLDQPRLVPGHRRRGAPEPRRRLIDDNQPSDVLILSGDQLYLMDMQRVRARATAQSRGRPDHRGQAGAAPGGEGLRHPAARPRRPHRRVRREAEGPTRASTRSRSTRRRSARSASTAPPGSLLASMGIYVFRPEVLREMLVGSPLHRLRQGGHPGLALDSAASSRSPTTATGRDIGTIPSFHQANLELTLPLPPLNLYDPDYPIYTHARFLPGTKINHCVGRPPSVLCEGRSSPARGITDSIVGIRAVVQTRAR